MNVYYHVTNQILKSGDIIKKGRYGDQLISEGLSQQNDPLGEWLREDIRGKNFPSKPSRLKSSFVFESLDDAIFFRKNWRTGENIYTVKFSHTNQNIHKVCYTAWSMNSLNLTADAILFWSRPCIYESNTELFCESDLEIISLINISSQ